MGAEAFSGRWRSVWSGFYDILSHVWSGFQKITLLGGGFNCFFFTLPGEMMQFDYDFFQWVETTNQFTKMSPLPPPQKKVLCIPLWN